MNRCTSTPKRIYTAVLSTLFNGIYSAHPSLYLGRRSNPIDSSKTTSNSNKQTTVNQSEPLTQHAIGSLRRQQLEASGHSIQS